jgi:hypothetical protein
MAKKIGYIICAHCGNSEATVKETETGTLSVSCHHCDISSFAKAGTKGARVIRASLVKIEDEEPEAAPPPKVSEKQLKPNHPMVKSSVFNLGNLGSKK